MPGSVAVLSLPTSVTCRYEGLVVGVTAVTYDPGVTPIVGSSCCSACFALGLSYVGRCSTVWASWIIEVVNWVWLCDFVNVDWIESSKSMLILIVKQFVVSVEIAWLNKVDVSLGLVFSTS